MTSADYRPTSRRPIAGLFRRTAGGAVAACVRLHIHPDAISYSSMVAAAAGAVCLWQSHRWPVLLLGMAPVFCYVRLWLNMLDGMVALALHTASPRGEILNDLPDRVSDVLIFVGVAHSGWCSPLCGYWAAIFALLTAYVGTLGQAVGARREFSGIMSKPWRMVVLHAGAWILAGMLLLGKAADQWHPSRLGVMDWACLAVIVGCVQTIAVRLVRIMRTLDRKL
jgi:phosphatidylglycerophosphate synthase